MQNVLDSILEENPELAEKISSWASRSPAEQAQGGRRLLYGVIEPALMALEEHDADVIAEVEAVFETLFRSIEQTTGRARSSASRTG